MGVGSRARGSRDSAMLNADTSECVGPQRPLFVWSESAQCRPSLGAFPERVA